MNKMQNETLHMKRTKEPRLIINDLINSVFLLFSFPFLIFLFNAEVGEFRALLLKTTFTLVKFKFVG